MINPTDETLIAKTRTGDMEAFNTLTVRHEGRVAGIVRSLFGATPFAEDIGQEVFLRFYDSLDRYREHVTVDHYIIKIVLKLCIHELKRSAKSRHHFSREVLESVNGQDELAVNEKLQQEFSLLEPGIQCVVVLRLVEGFSVEETAELMDVPTNEVLIRLARAQCNLRNALSAKIK